MIYKIEGLPGLGRLTCKILKKQRQHRAPVIFNQKNRGSKTF
jgi:hypothetical protein